MLLLRQIVRNTHAHNALRIASSNCFLCETIPGILKWVLLGYTFITVTISSNASSSVMAWCASMSCGVCLWKGNVPSAL